MKLNKIFGKLACVSALVVAAPLVSAELINGNVQFNTFGTFVALDDLGDNPVNTNLEVSDGIDFGALFGSGNGWGIDGAVAAAFGEGDLAVLNSNVGVIKDLAYNPSNTALDPFILFEDFSGTNDFSFALDTVIVEEQTDQFLNLTGTGRLNLTGFEETAGSWTLTATANGSEVVFNTIPSQTLTSVPEPSAAALLALGVVGLALGRRRSRRA